MTQGLIMVEADTKRTVVLTAKVVHSTFPSSAHRHVRVHARLYELLTIGSQLQCCAKRPRHLWHSACAHMRVQSVQCAQA